MLLRALVPAILLFFRFDGNTPIPPPPPMEVYSSGIVNIKIPDFLTKIKISKKYRLFLHPICLLSDVLPRHIYFQSSLSRRSVTRSEINYFKKLL